MAVTYQSVLDELNAFSLSDAANRNDAIGRVEEFMNKIRPKIDQVLRENLNLTAEEKRAFDEGEKRIFDEVDAQFANPAGGKRRRRARKTKKSRRRRGVSRKSRKNRRS